MHWSPADIADAVTAGLKNQAAADDLEQAVYGLDARDELALHPLIRHALQQAGYGAWSEQRYPEARTKRRRSEGQRCDLVLTRDGRPLRDPAAEATLFDAVVDAADWREAFWLEIKAVTQFTCDGPSSQYSRELLNPVTQDLRKLADAADLVHAGLPLVLFTADEEVAQHDIGAWLDRAWKRGLSLQPPACRGFAITDRLGNAWCGVAVSAVRG